MNNELIVLVKKWFDKVNGNTYHSVQFDFGNTTYHSGRVYGYERQYEQTFRDLYKKAMEEQRKVRTEYFIVIEDCKKKELDTIHEYK